MDQHKSAIPIEEKELNVGGTQHPWSKTVKDYLTQKIKYAHNSIRNPQYPVKDRKKTDSKESDEGRIQFTVIGDRVTKEFIFCSNLVRGLHKYRPKNFDVPIIRGVTTVEWPQVWNDLKIRFGTVANCLLTPVAVFRDDQIVGGEKDLKQLVEAKYIYHLCLDYNNEGVAEFSRFIQSSGRPTAYMHVSIDNKHIGTLIFMLYADVVPYTCENFLHLCNKKKGGYGGTPVQRIVAEGWIQCGGFSLVGTPLNCENFIIPFDKRGVLAMANDGRDVDCSTQFFVLLQPAPWMNGKYVAFGQLIEGAATLEKIESFPTWYESPTSKIILYRCGIFNMECHDIRINKESYKYIDDHIEDLNVFTELLWEHILEQVYLTAQLREIERLRELDGEGAESHPDDDAIRPTQRFKKEDIQKQIERNQEDQRSTQEDNKDFDVDEYVYEPEEDYNYQPYHPASLIVKPQKPYYIPLTDVPYAGDVESEFDLKKLLQGKYCLESDLEKRADKIIKSVTRFPSELLIHLERDTILGSSEDLNLESDEFDEELEEYLKDNVDRVSFAGGIVRSIAKKGVAKFNLIDDRKSSIDIRGVGPITDEKLRMIRLASVDIREQEERLAGGRVAIKAPLHLAGKIKRRQTGFVRQQDLEKVQIINDDGDVVDSDDNDSKIVRLNPIDVVEAEITESRTTYLPKRRPTGYVRPSDLASLIINYDNDDDDDDDDDDSDDDSDDDNANPVHAKMVKATVKKRASIAIEMSIEPRENSIYANRRATGFIRPTDFANLITKDDNNADVNDDDDDSDNDNVSAKAKNRNRRKKRSKPSEGVGFIDDNDTKPSVLTRLFKQVHIDTIPGYGPTLKNYKQLDEGQERENNLLTYNPIHRLQSNESTRAKYTRSVKPKESSVEEILDLQQRHGIIRKISSDHMRTLEKDHKFQRSLRSVEYAKTRPTMSVAEYRLKNRKYQEGLLQISDQVNTVMMPNVDFDMRASSENIQYTRDATSPEVKYPVK